MLLFVVLLHLGPRDAAAPALRPADELRLEDPAAAGDAQRRSSRRSSWSSPTSEAPAMTYEPAPTSIEVQRGPAPGGAGGFYRAFGETLRGLKTTFAPRRRGPGHDPVPRGEDRRSTRASAAATSSTASRTRASRSASAARCAPRRARPTASASSPPRTRPRTASPPASATPRSTRSTCRAASSAATARSPARSTRSRWATTTRCPTTTARDLIFTKEMLLAEPLERTPLRREGE